MDEKSSGPELCQGIPMGICKLCLKTRDLQLSHFMPKAAFRSLRGVLTFLNRKQKK
jgi:hypothetical protein